MLFKTCHNGTENIFKKIFDFLALLLMDNKSCLIKLQKMSTNNILSLYFVKGQFPLHKHCFILFYIK